MSERCVADDVNVSEIFISLTITKMHHNCSEVILKTGAKVNFYHCCKKTATLDGTGINKLLYFFVYMLQTFVYRLDSMNVHFSITT